MLVRPGCQSRWQQPWPRLAFGASVAELYSDACKPHMRPLGAFSDRFGLCVGPLVLSFAAFGSAAKYTLKLTFMPQSLLGLACLCASPSRSATTFVIIVDPLLSLQSWTFQALPAPPMRAFRPCISCLRACRPGAGDSQATAFACKWEAALSSGQSVKPSHTSPGCIASAKDAGHDAPYPASSSI
jgi:hypothetical protein